jgi:predicted metal-dependent hydrolase
MSRPDPATAPQHALFEVAPAQTLARHPQASHELLLEGRRVGYALRRARRRSIGLVIGADGLAVSAPHWVGLAEIEAALQAKSGWVLRKLGEQAERQRRLDGLRTDWRDGATLPYLGEPLRIVLDATVDGVRLDADAWPPGAAGSRRLRVGLPAPAAAAQIRDAVHGWLQARAREWFLPRCRHFEALLGVRMTRLTLSSAATRWGSASADGSIRLHWRLIQLPPASIDYVVAHELAHLREMHHGPAFWATVRAVLPHYEQQRRALREQAPLPG